MRASAAVLRWLESGRQSAGGVLMQAPRAGSRCRRHVTGVDGLPSSVHPASAAWPLLSPVLCSTQCPGRALPPRVRQQPPLLRCLLCPEPNPWLTRFVTGCWPA